MSPHFDVTNKWAKAFQLWPTYIDVHEFEEL